MDLQTLALFGLPVAFAAINFGPSLLARVKPAAVQDSDAKPPAAALAYVRAICDVPAPPERHVAALRDGLSVAEFMRSLLESPTPAARGSKK